MAKPTIKPLSRLNYDKYTNIDGFEFFEKGVSPDFNLPTNVFLTWKGNNRSDVISNRFYNDPQFFWAIALKNGFRDFLNDVSPGDKIKIPSFEEINDSFKVLGNMEKR